MVVQKARYSYHIQGYGFRLHGNCIEKCCSFAVGSSGTVGKNAVPLRWTVHESRIGTVESKFGPQSKRTLEKGQSEMTRSIKTEGQTHSKFLAPEEIPASLGNTKRSLLHYESEDRERDGDCRDGSCLTIDP